MKRMALIVALCLALAPACLAESSADEFLDNLSKTWDAFVDMAGDAGKSVSDWAEDAGVTEWIDGAVGDIAAWADESGLSEWAGGALEQISGWYAESGFGDYAQETLQEIQAFVDENRPAVEAWLAQAGEDVAQAWNTLVHPEGHTDEELRQAYEAVTDSLESAEGE